MKPNASTRSTPVPGARASALTALLGGVAMALCTPAQADIHIVTGSDYLPYSDQSAPSGGLATEVVTAAAALLNDPITIEWMRWKEGYLAAEAGQFDGTVPYYHTEERDAVFHYTDTIYDVVQSLFLKSDVRLPTSVRDVQGMRICNPEGYAAPAVLQAVFDQGRATELKPAGMTRCFELLALGQADAVLAPTQQGYRQIAESDVLDEFSVSRAPWDIHVATQSVILPHVKGAESCRLVARLNGAMAILRRDGSYDDIVRRHMGDKGDLARADEVYQIELKDGTRLRGQPSSYQRGVFIVDTLDGGQQLIPEDLLVLLRREGQPQFDIDNQECRDAMAGNVTVHVDVPTPSPQIPDLTLTGAPALADTVIPALIGAYSASDGDAPDIKETNGTGGRLYTVNGAARNKPDLFLVEGADPAQGFARMAQGRADLVLADRRATPAEVAMTGQFGGRGAEDAERVLALEAFAVIVNPANPLAYVPGGIAAEDIKAMARGEIRDWTALGYTLGPVSFGAAPGVSDLMPLTVGETGSEAVISRVAAQPGAIGLVPLSVAEGRNDIRLTEVSACEAQHRATPFAAKTEEYPFVRRLLAYLPASSNPHAGDFIAFAESPEGQRAISEAGAVSLGLAAQSVRENALTLAAVGQQGANAQNRAKVGEYSQLASAARRVSTTFRFQTGSDRLDARAIEDARRLARYMREDPQARGKTIQLVGFADAHGSASANLRLAQDRAESIQRQLRLEGFTSAQVMAVGEDLPVACNTSADGRALNRRVEVWLR